MKEWNVIRSKKAKDRREERIRSNKKVPAANVIPNFETR